MRPRIENLKDLFIEQTRELYDAIRREQEELPYFQRQVSHYQLKKLLDRRTKNNQKELLELQGSLGILGAGPILEISECCATILDEAKRLLHRSIDSGVRDAVILASFQKLIHYKITILGSMVSYAREIDQEKIAGSLQRLLEEEKAIDRRLSQLAERDINKKAGANVDSEFSVFRCY